MVTAVVLGAQGADPADAPAITSPSEPHIPSSSVGLTESEGGQTPLEMADQHHAMMDQMRASVSATMTNLMNTDPMWRTMRSSNLIADLEKHEQEIDKMLARGD